MRVGLLVAAFLAAAGCSVLSAQAPGAALGQARDFEIALHDGDLALVQRVAADRTRPRAQQALARAALAYWWKEDDQAGDGLAQAARGSSLPEGLRRNAWMMLAGLDMRQGRYADAAAALDAVLPQLTDNAERVDTQDARDINAALANSPPMQAKVSGPGSVPLTRDRAGLTRGPVTVNGQAIDAIIDTGSSVGTVSESKAKQLGLRILPAHISMGTATSTRATGGLAIADTLNFGGAEFRNVVFLVLPDSALSFANGAYVVEAIIGTPILRELGRIEYLTNPGKETLSFARTGGKPGPGSNLMLDAEDPFVLAYVDGSEAALRLFIDNGASTSHLNQRFAAAFPAIIAGAHRESVTRTGAAGSETQSAMKLPTLALRFGQRTAPITNVDVIDDHKTNRHGDLGLDALRAAPGYVLDFETMRLELLPGGKSADH